MAAVDTQAVLDSAHKCSANAAHRLYCHAIFSSGFSGSALAVGRDDLSAFSVAEALFAWPSSLGRCASRPRAPPVPLCRCSSCCCAATPSAMKYLSSVAACTPHSSCTVLCAAEKIRLCGKCAALQRLVQAARALYVAGTWLRAVALLCNCAAQAAVNSAHCGSDMDMMCYALA